MDQLPLLKYSLNIVGRLLPTKQELNMIIQNNIYKYFI